MTINVFHYLTFRLSGDRRTVHFDYRIEQAGQNYDLTETITFPVALRDTPAQAASLRALHLALGISYYKIFLPQLLKHDYEMDAAEAAFWNSVWRHGLGEFLYVNKLTAERLASFTAQAGLVVASEGADTAEPAGALLGIGGGKDSIVAGELLRDCEVAVSGFVMATGEQRGQAQAVADIMNVPLRVVERRLDAQLLELQVQPAAYKGHIPISLIFGLVGTALAVADGRRYVVVANEASASLPRLTWQGSGVNHQWSKSFGFEQQLQAYIHERVAAPITYFSAVRQLTSVGVAKLFAGYPPYFEAFTSDNFVFRIDPAKRPNSRWSLESPKSLSSFILLAPWLSEADMLRTFGQDFLDQPALSGLFRELTGLSGHPPLDCVGTVDELLLSLNLAAQHGKFQHSHLMELACQEGLLQANGTAGLPAALQLQPDQALPPELAGVISAHLQDRLAA